MSDTPTQPTITALEGPDELITLRRAGEISGLSHRTLEKLALVGLLQTDRPGYNHFTTRRWLHHYLYRRGTGRRKNTVRAHIPPEYVTPEGEEPING